VCARRSANDNNLTELPLPLMTDGSVALLRMPSKLQTLC
jgi:hypothetical protein